MGPGSVASRERSGLPSCSVPTSCSKAPVGRRPQETETAGVVGGDGLTPSPALGPPAPNPGGAAVNNNNTSSAGRPILRVGGDAVASAYD